MSAVLLVTNQKKQANKVRIAQVAFTIGRSQQCDLPLDEPKASRRHAEITQIQDAFWINDCGSTNGTAVNGQILTGRHQLQDGDEIGIGETRLKFLQDAKGKRDENPEEEATRAAVSGVPEIKAVGRKVVEKKDKALLRVTLRVIDGPGQGAFFRDWEGPLTIGRAKENHVVILDDRVSAHHARIVQEQGRYWLENLSQHNPTFLNKVVVQRAPLSDGQKIGITGVAVLAFELVDLQVRRRHLNIALITSLAMAVLILAIKLLLPPDVAGQHVEKAHYFRDRGELLKAKTEFQAALKVDGNRIEASRELKLIEDSLSAQEHLAQAETNAAAGNYASAMTLVQLVLRQFPKYNRALELEAVIQSVEDAKLAFEHRNWPAAVIQLQKAQDKYPKSELINDRLKDAQAELAAERALSSAMEAIDHEQFGMAREFLKKIGTNSVYLVEAAQRLQHLDLQESTASGIRKAQALYREARLTDALGELDLVLQSAPDHAAARALQALFRKMQALSAPLDHARTLAAAPTEDVSGLLEARKVCEDVLALEPDTLNSMRKNAQATRSQLLDELQGLSKISANQAQELLQRLPRLNVNATDAEIVLKLENLETARQLKRAWDLLAQALRADERNPIALQATNSLHEQIVGICTALYSHGNSLEEFGSENEHKTAQQCFHAVVEIGVAGERVCELARKKLK